MTSSGPYEDYPIIDDNALVNSRLVDKLTLSTNVDDLSSLAETADALRYVDSILRNGFPETLPFFSPANGTCPPH